MPNTENTICFGPKKLKKTEPIYHKSAIKVNNFVKQKRHESEWSLLWTPIHRILCNEMKKKNPSKKIVSSGSSALELAMESNALCIFDTVCLLFASLLLFFLSVVFLSSFSLFTRVPVHAKHILFVIVFIHGHFCIHNVTNKCDAQSRITINYLFCIINIHWLSKWALFIQIGNGNHNFLPLFSIRTISLLCVPENIVRIKIYNYSNTPQSLFSILSIQMKCWGCERSNYIIHV